MGHARTPLRRRRRPRHAAWYMILALVCVATESFARVQAAPSPPQQPAAAVDPATAFFNAPVGTPIPDINIAVTDDDLQKLRDKPREYVPCSVVENRREAVRARVKLKGAAGSFREVDDHPAFTISTDRTGAKTPVTFHGLEKFHLNNSVQDESLLNEWVCTEIFRDAGYPAARVAHARVSINGRDLGMYVLKEGFDRPFLIRHPLRATTTPGAAPAGNLYDGGFLQDVDADLQRDFGKGEDDHADLRRISDACRADDLQARWPELDRLVDIDALNRFAVLERIVGHWDGYTQNRNNYRLFIPAQGSEGKAWFIPHGMDQTLSDPQFPLLDEPVGMVAVAVMRNPVWRAAYRAELSKQAAAFSAPSLIRRINALQSRLQPALKKIDAETARHQAQLARELIRRLRARSANIREQAARPEPKPLVFAPSEPVLIDGWLEVGETEGAIHQDVQLDGETWKRLACPDHEDRCVCSWRRSILLPRGRYTLEAEARSEGIEPIKEVDTRGLGGGLRISGVNRTEGLTGTSRKHLRFEFDVADDREVVLVLELRAVRGSVAFKADSIKLTRIEPPRAP